MLGSKHRSVSSMELTSNALIVLGTKDHLACPGRFSKGGQRMALSKRTFFDIRPSGTRPFIIGAGGVSIATLKATFRIFDFSNSRDMRAILLGKGIGMRPGSRGRRVGKRCVLRPGRGLAYRMGNSVHVSHMSTGSCST